MKGGATVEIINRGVSWRVRLEKQTHAIGTRADLVRACNRTFETNTSLCVHIQCIHFLVYEHFLIAMSISRATQYSVDKRFTLVRYCVADYCLYLLFGRVISSCVLHVPAAKDMLILYVISRPWNRSHLVGAESLSMLSHRMVQIALPPLSREQDTTFLFYYLRASGTSKCTFRFVILFVVFV
jgi:hypothetical protein